MLIVSGMFAWTGATGKADTKPDATQEKIVTRENMIGNKSAKLMLPEKISTDDWQILRQQLVTTIEETTPLQRSIAASRCETGHNERALARATNWLNETT